MARDGTMSSSILMTAMRDERWSRCEVADGGVSTSVSGTNRNDRTRLPRKGLNHSETPRAHRRNRTSRACLCAFQTIREKKRLKRVWAWRNHTHREKATFLMSLGESAKSPRRFLIRREWPIFTAPLAPSSNSALSRRAFVARRPKAGRSHGGVAGYRGIDNHLTTKEKINETRSGV